MILGKHFFKNKTRQTDTYPKNVYFIRKEFAIYKTIYSYFVT